LEELQALIGVYAHIGDNLQKAARVESTEVVPIIHLLRTTAAAARRARLAFNDVDLKDFYASWNFQVPDSAVAALGEMRDELMAALPTSSADETEGEDAAGAGGREVENDGGVRATPAGAATASTEPSAPAGVSIGELTGIYMRAPGLVEFKRELARARATQQRLTMASVQVAGARDEDDHVRDVAAVLCGQLRPYDVIVRHGVEFHCATPGMTVDEAWERMNNVQTALKASPSTAAVKVGVASLDDEDSVDTLMRRADQARESAR